MGRPNKIERALLDASSLIVWQPEAGPVAPGHVQADQLPAHRAGHCAFEGLQVAEPLTQLGRQIHGGRIWIPVWILVAIFGGEKRKVLMVDAWGNVSRG